MSITREEANKCLKSLMRVLIIKEGDKYRPAKDTSRQDAYRALYEIQEALGTRRIEREEALLENMQDLELALSALRPFSREQVEKVFSGCEMCREKKEVKSDNFCGAATMRIVGDSIDLRGDEKKIKFFGHIYAPSFSIRFCPFCGRPLTDEAVQMVMERLEALYENHK